MAVADAYTQALLDLKGEVGELRGGMTGIGREIGDIKKLLQCKSEDCTNCRKEIDASIGTVAGKVTIIEDAHKGEQAVKTWKDVTIGQLVLGIGAAGGLLGLVITGWNFITGKGGPL